MKTLIQPVITALCMLVSSASVAQVPVLNSMPSATATLYLDFNGQVVVGTDWNYLDTIIVGPSGLNNVQVTEVFNRIAEDYRPFALNVTTDSSKFFAAPLNRRMRLILTVSNQWYGNAGGAAFIGSFTWGTDCPAFVFTAALNFNVKFISEAGSHELGHTLRLEHHSVYDSNCVKISEYNFGIGIGEIGWAPIMGSGYYQNFTLWNFGPNTYACDSLQNDLVMMTTMNGVNFRNDDHNAAFNQATNTSFSGGQFDVNGVIEQNTDADMFKFTLQSAGQFRLDAIPYNVGSNNAGSDLDMQVTLYNNNHVLLNEYNPGILLNSVIDTFLTVGTYFLKVEGRGNIYAPNYASLGSYQLRGNFIIISLPLHRLELRGIVNSDQHQLNWIIDADEEVVRQVLEYSYDGIHFQQLTIPANSARQFTYRPTVNRPTQYRLFVSFSNGRDYYSNVITLRNGNEAKPRLIGNTVTTSLSVSSPANYDYTIFNLNGMKMAQGKIEKGTQPVDLPPIATGMYTIRFDGRNGDVFTEKFVRK